MMVQSLSLNSLASSFTGANNELPRIIPSSRFHVNSSTIRCCSRSNSYIPKLEPFSRTRFDRAVKDPPLIEKSENELADYCSVLEGDDSYSCWQAYFELKDLEKEEPKEEVERLILQAGGVKTLISCLHGISEMHKARNRSKESAKAMNLEAEGARHCPIPDGLPKTREELEEEEKARMPDSPYTKLLRARGTHPVWYSTTLDY
ncbi:CCG-binding protein 1 [Capsicum chacoense]|uniref:CCG-binding protein 1 n=1 Tax=Capsicum annuum TaxID=4072 RepID=UPI0007BEDD30|nr:CCG-binding protein 1 [Capsicum annuum]XP_047251085.1 CCG-binding protein 1 [Capsicum annuum]KAF3664337.1 Maternal effect embryo arrest 14 isoform 2 [Capsicum annuum]KAF3667190.1 Maternal effect embryo arrest 14 isoform 2 [Capsicum annuum]